MREGDHARGQARHPLGSEIREGMAGDYLPQPLDELPTALGIGLGEDQRELVAAVASREVGRADLALQQGADLGEHAVAGLLPEPLVDLAQPVDVDHDQCESERVAPRALELVAQPAVQGVQACTPREHVRDARADLAAVHRGAPLLVLEHPSGRLGDRVGESHILGLERGVPLHRPQQEHAGGTPLHEDGKRHRGLHVDLELLRQPPLADRFEQRMLVHVLDDHRALGANRLLDLGVALQVHPQVADSRVLVHRHDAAAFVAGSREHEGAVRQPEHPPHPSHENLENLVGAKRRRHFLEDVEQHVAGAEGVPSLVQLAPQAEARVDAGAQLAEVHRAREGVLGTRLKRVTHRLGPAVREQDDERGARKPRRGGEVPHRVPQARLPTSAGED